MVKGGEQTLLQPVSRRRLWICFYAALRSFARPAVTTLPQPSFPHQLCEEAQPTFPPLQKDHLDGVQTAARKAEQRRASEASFSPIKVEETSVYIYKPRKYHQDPISSVLRTSEQQMMDLGFAASLQKRLESLKQESNKVAKTLLRFHMAD